MEKYLKYLNKNNYSKNTIKTYYSILKNYQNEINDIRLVKRKIKTYFSSPNTAQLHYNVILTYYKFTKNKKINSLKNLKLPQQSYKYIEVFSKKFLEGKTLINKKDTENIINKKLTIKFLFETGIRAEELKNIISVNKFTLTIKGKGNKKREVFYNKNTYKQMKPFIYTTKTLRLWVKEILGKNFSPHSIRRSHATHMLLKGANPKTVMLQLGHSKIETTFKYLQLDLKTNKNIYKKYY